MSTSVRYLDTVLFRAFLLSPTLRCRRHQDTARSDRGGVADGAGVEAKVTMQRRDVGRADPKTPGLKF